ncbi:Cytoplasmic thioredoxin isoenzyme 2 [Peltigera leucophlebia]|nr:Cytoplasmic thioredoxin isoenzyme 2 [Peltigera leucophlebia]
MGVHNITSREQYEDAIKQPGFAVIDAFATWCGPCKVIAPEIVKLSDEHTGARFYKIDVDEHPEIAAELEVRAMPTFIFFKDGQKIQQVVGANKPAIEAIVVEHAPKK